MSLRTSYRCWIFAALLLISFLSLLFFSDYQRMELGRGAENYLRAKICSLSENDYREGLRKKGSTVESRNDELVITDAAKVIWSFPVGVHSTANKAVVADVTISDIGYRGYVNLSVREGDNAYCSKVWALSEGALWKEGERARLVLPLRDDIKLKNAQIEVISYMKDGGKVQKVRVHDLALYQMSPLPDPGAKKLKTLAIVLLLMNLLAFLILYVKKTSVYLKGKWASLSIDKNYVLMILTGSLLMREWSLSLLFGFVTAFLYYCERNKAGKKTVKTVLGGASLLLVSIAAYKFIVQGLSVSWGPIILCAVWAFALFLSSAESQNMEKEDRAVLFLFFATMIIIIGAYEAFPLDSSRLRADAWSYDLIARSLAGGFGFKSYNVWEPGTYPVVPFFYSLFYRILGDGSVTAVWANIATLLFAWLIIFQIFSRISLSSVLISGILLCACSSLWTLIGWTLSETLSQLALLLLVFAGWLIIKKKESSKKAYFFLLGGCAGISLLIRSDFYALIPILILFTALVAEKKQRLVSLFFFLSAMLILLVPWWAFQRTHKNPYIEYFATDYSRIKNAVAGRGVSSGGMYGLDIKKIRTYTSNLAIMLLRPYLRYVDDVPPRRNEIFSKELHLCMIGLFLSAVIVSLCTGNALGKKITLMIVAMVLFRTGYLILLSDNPRYFSHHLLLIIILIAGAWGNRKNNKYCIQEA